MNIIRRRNWRGTRELAKFEEFQPLVNIIKNSFIKREKGKEEEKKKNAF